MTFDISDSLAPASDQLDAIELIAGPRTFVVESVSQGPADQPVQVHLKDFPRPWRPGKSMRRVLAAGWGTNASEWVGRSVRLFCDQTIRFGPDIVGGTRIESMSHLNGTLKVPLLIKRGKSAVYTVEPLKEDAPTPEPTTTQVAACTDLDQLGAMWRASGPERRTQIEERVAEIKAAALDSPAESNA